MKRFALIFALAAGLFGAGLSAAAADCASAAAQAAAQRGAQVLKVQAQGGTCIVTLRVPGQNGQPPRVETIQVSG